MTSIPLLLRLYLDRTPGEADKLDRLQRLVAHTDDPAQLIDRANTEGHVTASGFVVDRARRTLLLVYHKGLGLYVQPGGHLERSDASPLEGARREVREETGIHALTYHPVTDAPLVPFDIDTHFIPANPRKGEGEHWHHDFRYLFVCEDGHDAVTDPAEVDELRWVPFDALDRYPTFESVAVKIRHAATYLFT